MQRQLADATQPADQLPFHLQDMSESDRNRLAKRLRSDIDRTQRDLKTSMHDWQLAWHTYQTRVSLLQLDLQQARQQLDQRNETLNSVLKGPEGLVSKTDFRKLEAEKDQSEVQVQRAEEVLRLYQGIGEKNPELDPSALKPETSDSPEAPEPPAPADSPQAVDPPAITDPPKAVDPPPGPGQK